MKRLTVSLPDDLAERVQQAAGPGSVSGYVAAALRAYSERERLDDILADWNAQTPVDRDLQSEVAAEMEQAGLVDQRGGHRQAG